ncbi:MAG: hypothetical protein ACYCW6_15075 [Candidatus Xenobia bacterium]
MNGNRLHLAAFILVVLAIMLLYILDAQGVTRVLGVWMNREYPTYAILGLVILLVGLWRVVWRDRTWN